MWQHEQLIKPSYPLPARWSCVQPLTQGANVKTGSGDMISKSLTLRLAPLTISSLISPSLPLLLIPHRTPTPLAPPLRYCVPRSSQSRWASLLSNSVWRLKGGNYIHAAWPLWTLSRPLPRLLTGNWFKGPHWHLRDGSRELWKCQKSFAVCVHVCVCLPWRMLDANIPWWRIL